MPFKSKAQRDWLRKNKPEVAKKFEQEEKWGYSSIDDLPDHVPKKEPKRKRNFIG
jgi:hypothetical protein